ncbi:hypothetical protein G1K75_10290 [Tenacibaculum finnmarkense]|uniref:sugar-transfer associated ATP-grasp domain-containing protein n=1 Tax=Tenacibaculum finnmarkense TaxID=2781243 RepID=UPI001E346437|nr:sugar-transfer associated ATP-grasp domain-containing protein [Tenacibaculum finnmarkense]MCD8403387.1 hypothetical protein [Tenacibaculum finnmarkense genomovar finnmarkense]MCD8447600.1 hypothetical protein [Tenacibaculum finnmarkense genomovar finnmarkense]MCG8806040.1 hypothetical protein [Tenacibaculum finnmarkense]MCG8857079.1 hypothetical protein [Tenacibaculum finnmarkense]WCC47592.1 sugar-transfer associated ATP-grasp domain-containing protein [Tenacibaculum finnmarkense]
MNLHNKLRNIWRKRVEYKFIKGYWKKFDTIKKSSPEYFAPEPNEKEYLEKWNTLGYPIKIDTYRVFSKFVKNDINLFPIELFPVLIEPVLSPKLTAICFEEKNLYDRLFAGVDFDGGILPETLFRNMAGSYMDAEYRVFNPKKDVLFDFLNGEDEIIIKPSIDSGGGKGIEFFERIGNEFINKEGDKLSCEYLDRQFKKDFICQKLLKQSKFGKQFNASSINTVRVRCYKSVLNHEIHILNNELRIGGVGSKVDNKNSGGVFCPLKRDGSFSNYVLDLLAVKYGKFNGVDFENTNFRIANFEKVLNFAKMICECITTSHLISLDIALCENDQLRLVEVNITGFDTWSITPSLGSHLGEFTDEIINYCVEHIDENPIGIAAY